jgi:hypothetical protein
MTTIDALSKRELNQKLRQPLSESALKKLSKEALVEKLEAEKPRSRGADRVLFDLRPDELKLPRTGSKRHLLIHALDAGLTLEEMEKSLGWKRDTITSAIYLDVRACGLGVERRDGSLRLLKPENLIVTKMSIAFAEDKAHA